MACSLTEQARKPRARVVLGDHARARAVCGEALDIFWELGDRWGVTNVHRDLMLVAQRQGDVASIVALGHECLILLRELGNRAYLADCYERLAWVANARREPEQAARLLGAAEAAREAAGLALVPARRPDRDQIVVTARRTLGEETLAAAWAQGRTMSLEQAVAYALETTSSA